MTIVSLIMRIILQIKIIARDPKSIYHSLHYHKKEQQVEEVIKSFKTALHKSLPNNIETKNDAYRNKTGFQFPN